MARRDEDTRPPIEVLGADLGIESTRSVMVGPRRPKPGRGRALAAAAAVIAVLVGGVLLGGDDGDAERASEEERDNSSRVGLPNPLATSTAESPTTTTRPTTTTTAAPTGPPLGDPVEGMLLTFSGGGWVTFDLETGVRQEVELPREGGLDSVSVANGIVMTTGGGLAVYHQLLGAEPPKPQDLGPADQILRASADRVWLIHGTREPGRVDGSAEMDVRLVDLEGRVLRSFTVAGRRAEGATADTILVSRGGRVYAADERGLRAIATGWITGVVGDDAVVQSCDDGGACGLWQQPVDGGARRLLHEIRDPDATYYDWISSNAGRLAVMQYDESGHGSSAGLLLYDESGSSLGTLDEIVETFDSRPSWLPGNLGLVVPSVNQLMWIRLASDGPVLEPLPLDRAGTEAVFVITP